MKGVVVKKKPAVASVSKTATVSKPTTIGEKDDADLAARASTKREAEDAKDDPASDKKQKM
jgi:hypothetical protein